MTMPGWYPDPHGSPLQRYWDGAAWTEHTQAAAPPPVPQGPASGFSYVAPLPAHRPARPPSPWYRRRLIIIAAAVLAALIIIGGVGAALGSPKKKNASADVAASASTSATAISTPASTTTRVNHAGHPVVDSGNSHHHVSCRAAHASNHHGAVGHHGSRRNTRARNHRVEVHAFAAASDQVSEGILGDSGV